MTTIYGDGYIALEQADERARAVQWLKDEFLAAVRRGDLSAPAYFAPIVKWIADGKRHPRVVEMLSDASDGLMSEEVLRILCTVAYGSEPQTLAARELLDRMAGKWADFAYRGE